MPAIPWAHGWAWHGSTSLAEPRRDALKASGTRYYERDNERCATAQRCTVGSSRPLECGSDQCAAEPPTVPRPNEPISISILEIQPAHVRRG